MLGRVLPLHASLSYVYVYMYVTYYCLYNLYNAYIYIYHKDKYICECVPVRLGTSLSDPLSQPVNLPRLQDKAVWGIVSKLMFCAFPTSQG